MRAGPPTQERSRNVMFTVFASQTEPLLLLDPEAWPGIRYCVYQRELCPTTNREHFQGYAEFDAPVRWPTVQSWPGMETAHLEARLKSQRHAIRYCTKEETRIEGPWTWGEAANQGARTDLAQVKRRLDEGASMAEIAQEHFSDFVRYERGFASYRRMVGLRRTWPTLFTIIVGPTRTGKTRRAWELAGPEAYSKNKTAWWDGYDQQENVVWDEFYGSCCPFTELLQILDRYPYAVNQKGKTTEFVARHIYFTTNQEPEDWYDAERTHQGPWAENPLRARIAEFGTIVRTGEVHRRLPPVLIPPEP